MILASGARKAFFMVLLLSSTAYAADDLFPVIKSDGSVDYYRLKPARHDVGHDAIVQERLMGSAPLAAIPASYSIPREKLPPVRDQGQRGTCAYFATLGLLETFYIAQSPANQKIDLSVECLTDLRNWMFDDPSYAGSDKPTVKPDPNGDDPDKIASTIQNNGVPPTLNFSSIYDCTYTGYPYGHDLSLDQYGKIFATGTNAFGKGLRFDVDTAPTFDKIKALIAADIPVEIGVTVYDEDFNNDYWRFDASQDNDDHLAGEHAIQLVGYKSNGVFEFKNSWGLGWGASGYGDIDERLITHGWGYDKSLDMAISLPTQ